ATFTAGRGAAAAPAGARRLASSFLGKGCPGCAAIACCLAANGAGGGGGAFFAITCRFITAAGGAVTWFAVEAFAPSTAAGVGFTATLALTGAALSCSAFTATAAFATGCALAKARCGTAVTAPCTFRFAYVTFVMVVLLVLLLIIVVL